MLPKKFSTSFLMFLAKCFHVGRGYFHKYKLFFLLVYLFYNDLAKDEYLCLKITLEMRKVKHAKMPLQPTINHFNVFRILCR